MFCFTIKKGKLVGSLFLFDLVSIYAISIRQMASLMVVFLWEAVEEVKLLRVNIQLYVHKGSCKCLPSFSCQPRS